MRMYFEAGRKAFQRNTTYKVSNLTGIGVNSFFGYIHCYLFLAVFSSAGSKKVADFSQIQAISYVWLSQALISVCQLWFDQEISQTIETGDVVSDFARPFDFQIFWFSKFVGNSFFALCFRAIPTYGMGMLFFGAICPQLMVWPLFGLSLLLAVMDSFLISYIFNLTTFWTLNSTGPLALGAALQLFFSGFVVPLAFMPDWFQLGANLLPFRTIINIPVQIWLEQTPSWTALIPQIIWLLILWLAAKALTRKAMQKVTIQGG